MNWGRKESSDFEFANKEEGGAQHNNTSNQAKEAGGSSTTNSTVEEGLHGAWMTVAPRSRQKGRLQGKVSEGEGSQGLKGEGNRRAEGGGDKGTSTAARRAEEAAEDKGILTSDPSSSRILEGRGRAFGPGSNQMGMGHCNMPKGSPANNSHVQMSHAGVAGFGQIGKPNQPTSIRKLKGWARNGPEIHNAGLGSWANSAKAFGGFKVAGRRGEGGAKTTAVVGEGGRVEDNASFDGDGFTVARVTDNDVEPRRERQEEEKGSVRTKKSQTALACEVGRETTKELAEAALAPETKGGSNRRSLMGRSFNPRSKAMTIRGTPSREEEMR